jgi:GDPmannose 4,6-dehydratase
VTARRALITGITGQDGHYLAQLLGRQGLEVVGGVRDPMSAPDGVDGASALVRVDLADPASLRQSIAEVTPDELYHLAAPTFVPDSWRDPSTIVAAIVTATAVLLAGVREDAPGCRVVVASSSEVFGDAGVSPQDERSPMRPRSPYGVAKLAAHGLVGAMRSQGLHASSAICFNHESPRRPERFLPRKVTAGAAAIAAGEQDELVLGDLDAVRDWSDARDVVRGFTAMARAEEAGDYVLASGRGRTVGDLAAAAFARVGIDDWRSRVRVDPAFVRPPEPFPLVGDPSLARERLGWTAEIPFETTIGEMVDADAATVRERR